MTHHVRFGIPESTHSTEGGNIFGSCFVTSSANSNIFGGQSDQVSTVSSNVFESLSGQTSQPAAPFGFFGDLKSEASSMFGSVAELGAKRDGIDVFGGAANMPCFSGQSSSSQPSSGTIFGSNFGFGTAATMAQTTNSTTNAVSHVFGTPGSVQASNPFGTSQSTILFNSNNQPSSNLFARITSSSTNNSFGTGQSGVTQPMFSGNQPTQGSSMNVTSFDTPSISSPPFSVPSSNVFGSFSSNSTSGSSNSRPVIGPSSSGFRKRDSNGTFGGNTLFGKQDSKAPVQFGTHTVPSTAPPPFTMKQNVPIVTASSLFGGATSSSSDPGFKFTRIFRVGPHIPSLQAPHIPAISAAAESASQSAKQDSASSDALFRNNADFGSSQERSSSDGLFKKSNRSSDKSHSTLFGKLIQTNRSLFGKDSRSQDGFGKNEGVSSERDLKEQRPGVENERDRRVAEHSSSTYKSPSKWGRGRNLANTDRKRREVAVSPEYARDSKKSKPVESDTSKPAPVVLSRSSSLRLSVDDLSPKNSLIVKDIPSHLNRVPVLRKHFSNFGTITRLQPLPMKRAANIVFKTHEEAVAAKNDGKYLVAGDPPLSIFWRVGPKPKSPDRINVQFKEHKKEPVLPKKKPVPGSVEDELASMAELPDFQEEFLAAPKHHDLPKTAPVRRRSPTPPPAPPVQDVDVARGLFKSIYKARAKDMSEKVAILDSRDKLLRLLRGRQQSDLATAKAFVGTCPDMCPEKERYYREDIRRLSVYEVIPSTMTSLTGLKSKVDHMYAVKEYSRSSADQDEPLAHELRPLTALVTTMNYLLSKIADLGEDGKWSEWYDFLWNRTRGIRKDITQQQLCDVLVAELLEKCARFHIFCSERLCEEDMMTFDAKINNENLTKCLQTLKELYADLEKRETICPNEAEFRGYMVLMNLNEGDILREIQQLRPEIRDSPHISFAVQVYNALNTNNYVRFFRLIEEKATFLSACILHRYFNQIRSKALLTIMKAHNALNKTILYPVEELIRLLCFEDAKEVELFCYHYCLSLKGVDVVLDSKAYAEPEGSLPQTRSQSLIEIKQENTSVGEVLNGSSPLPPLQLPYPSSSFDQDGVFIMSSDISEALDSSKLFRPKVTPIVQEIVVQREKMLYSNEVVKSLARIIILEVIDTSIEEICQEVFKEEMDLSVVIMTEIEDMVNSSTVESLRQIAGEVYEEQESMLRKKLEEELATQRKHACNIICEDIVAVTVADMTKEVAEKEMSLVEAEIHHQRVERCSQQYSEDILRLVVDEMIEDMAADVYDVDVVMKRERLEATETLVEMIRCRRFFQAWRMKYLALIRVKRAMLDFPSAPPAAPLKDQIHKLVPFRPDVRISQKSFYIGERSKLSIASPMDVIQEQLHLTVHLSMASARHMLLNLVMWRPLDMAHAVNAPLQRAFKAWMDRGLIDTDTAYLHWKLVVSLPKSGQTSSPEETFSKWIRAKLARSAERDKLLRTVPSYEGEVLSNYQTSDSDQKLSTVPTGICIRCFHGAWTDNEEISVKEKCLLKGASAVMFILSSAESLQSLKHATWQREKNRLHQVLKQKPQSPALPLVVIVPRVLSSSSISVKELDDNLGLSDLYKQNLVMAVHVAELFLGDQTQLLQCFTDWTTLLTDCLRFAATNIPAPPKLRAKPASDYIEDMVVEFYKTSVYEDLRARTRKQLLHQSPNTLLSLYNDVVEHAAMTSASGLLTQISWPAPEFDQSLHTGHPRSFWNTEAYMCDLYELISKMRLPYFRYSDLEADDWSAVCQDVWSYVATVTKKDSGFAKIFLHQQVAELLCRSKKSFHQFCWLAYKDGPCEPTYINMAWTDLIDACIHYKLMSLRTGQISLRRYEDEDELTEDGQEPEEVVVYYQESELDEWEPPLIWHDAQMGTEVAEPGLLKASVERAAEVIDEPLSDRIDTSITNEESAETTPSRNTFQQEHTITTSLTDDRSTSSWTNLKILLEGEKAASEKYEKSLRSCLSMQNDSLQMDSRNVISSWRPLLSPILSDKNTSYHGLRNIKDRFGESFRASQGSPYYLGVSPVSRSFRRTPGAQRRDWDSLDATGEGNIFSLPPTLSERVLDLQHTLLSEKQADVLFEIKLKSFIDPVLDKTEEFQ